MNFLPRASSIRKGSSDLDSLLARPIVNIAYFAASPFQARALRWPALAILLLLPIGIFRDWRYPRYVDYNFPSFVDGFKQSAPGTKFTILINPPGWEMHLIKH